MEQERIPFDIKYRHEIEAGKYLVQTRLGSPARIICWDKKCYYPEDCYPIVALVNNKFENVNIYSKMGKYDYKERKSNLDLFLVVNPDYKEPIAEPSISVEQSVDWDAFRRDAAKDFASAMLSNSELVYERSCSYRLAVTKSAVVYADELIKRLKGDTK